MSCSPALSIGIPVRRLHLIFLRMQDKIRFLSFSSCEMRCLLTFFEENVCKRRFLTVVDVLGHFRIKNVMWFRNSRCPISRKLRRSQDCWVVVAFFVKGLMSPLSVHTRSSIPDLLIASI